MTNKYFIKISSLILLVPIFAGCGSRSSWKPCPGSTPTPWIEKAKKPKLMIRSRLEFMMTDPQGELGWQLPDNTIVPISNYEVKIETYFHKHSNIQSIPGKAGRPKPFLISINPIVIVLVRVESKETQRLYKRNISDSEIVALNVSYLPSFLYVTTELPDGEMWWCSTATEGGWMKIGTNKTETIKLGKDTFRLIKNGEHRSVIR